MAWIQNQFNAWLGSNITFIANATKSDIEVFVSSDEIKIIRIGKDSLDIENKTYQSKFWIPSKKFHKIERVNAYDYLTVFNKDKSSLVCENYKMGANKSYIITEDNQIRRQKYGSSNLFEDEYGDDYS